MITWMQRHKKWLVITIWISTIAFVGAGFVGWGAYDFGKSQGAVAKVGDREISFAQLNNEYSNLYNQYSKMFGEQFNKEMAKQLKLEEAAYNSLIQKNLLLSFADELGLDVLDEEVAKELVIIPAFAKDGKFDKEIYIKVLNQNRTTPAEFEASIKEDLLLKKIQNLFAPFANSSEIENLSKLMFSEDKIKVKVIDGASINVPNDEAKMKAFWETNKNRYMSANSYELEFVKLPILSDKHSKDEMIKYYSQHKNEFKKVDGKIKSYEEAKADIIHAINLKASKKVALKQYLKIKKGKMKFEQTGVIYEDKLGYSHENLEKLKAAKEGTILKPFLEGNEYIIVRVLKKFPPKPLSYSAAKNDVKKDFEVQSRKMLLSQKATNELKEFKGKDIGYVNKESIDKIPGLNAAEATQFLKQLFNTTNKKDIIMIGEKAVVYEVMDSKLAAYNESRNSSVRRTLLDLKGSELLSRLIEKLQNRYEVKSFMAKGE